MLMFSVSQLADWLLAQHALNSQPADISRFPEMRTGSAVNTHRFAVFSLTGIGPKPSPLWRFLTKTASKAPIHSRHRLKPRECVTRGLLGGSGVNHPVSTHPRRPSHISRSHDEQTACAITRHSGISQKVRSTIFFITNSRLVLTDVFIR